MSHALERIRQVAKTRKKERFTSDFSCPCIIGYGSSPSRCWTANDADKTVTVKIEGATFPNYVGTEQKRQYAISGDQLTITNPMHAVGGGVLKIVLTRAK
jgi:hypothetical protein